MITGSWPTSHIVASGQDDCLISSFCCLVAARSLDMDIDEELNRLSSGGYTHTGSTADGVVSR